MKKLLQTPSQTGGPFFSCYLFDEYKSYPLKPFFKNEGNYNSVILRVVLYDGKENLVTDAFLETWQADRNGKYISFAEKDKKHTNFNRVFCNFRQRNRYIIKTFKPGIGRNQKTPYLNITLFARGLLNHLHTRIYFSDEEVNNMKDDFYSSVDKKRKKSIVARLVKKERNTNYYDFDIYLSGKKETVFIEI